ncbi:hypothetical protein [Arthrobacter sp. CAN_C5]|uniref:hypothetical protein n=1 Tax=Arthrobacter sp. CAN_C5 TaxID=2760706 RepID=UPI001FD880E6|nr:hypothetical protein [Arthrobacter sp. CAN_C5]MBP2216022.1 hypothetical protein [Arthrobacter sp. CAN_C5]
MQQAIYRLARSGGIETNPMTFSQKSGVFSSAATEHGAATLLTRREDTGLNGYLILPEKSLASNAPLHLAHTVGARAEEAELPEDLGNSPAIGELTYRRSPALRETQAGIDPTELPRLLANAMPAGSWVAVTMRKPANKERARYTAWLANRLGTAVPTHHSVHPTAVAMTITAGGSGSESPRGASGFPPATSSGKRSSPWRPTSPPSKAKVPNAGCRGSCSVTTPSPRGKPSTPPPSLTTHQRSLPPRTGCAPVTTPT